MSEIDFSVRLIGADGRGLSGRRVSVHYDMTSDSGYTGGDGWVSFQKSNIAYSGMDVSIYVRGQLIGQAWVENGDSLSFAV